MHVYSSSNLLYVIHTGLYIDAPEFNNRPNAKLAISATGWSHRPYEDVVVIPIHARLGHRLDSCYTKATPSMQ